MSLIEHIPALETAVASHPDRHDLRDLLSRAYLEAAAHFWGLAAAQQEPDELEKAVLCYLRGFELAPERSDSEFIEAYFWCAICASLQGRMDLAIDTACKAIAIQEKLTAVHPLAHLGIRFLQTRSSTLNNIGHL